MKQIIKELGDGLVLRKSSVEDAEALADFNARVHSDFGPDTPSEEIRVWTQDLLLRPHPTFKPDDFTVVEDTQNRKIVSAMNLIDQTWSYGGIAFEVGRPELVGTLPEYRNRGLVRAQFDVIHQWSTERGQQLLGITGIPYYYRLFGYEMAMDLGGGRVSFRRFVPRLKEGEEEPFPIRPARPADLGFIANLYEQSGRRYLVNCLRDEALWLYELEGKSPANANRVEINIIETPGGEPVGYLTHFCTNWGTAHVANAFEIKPGVPWNRVTHSVMRFLMATGERLASEEGKLAEFDGLGFWLGREHPVYLVLHDSLPRIRKPYAWYLRVPNLPGFVQHVAPVLEQNLVESPYQGYSGELKLTFYRDGLLLGFEQGRLVKIEAYHPAPVGHSGDAGFPDLTFLQLLFGYRSLSELSEAFADCFFENDDAFGLIEALFPKKLSNVWMVS